MAFIPPWPVEEKTKLKPAGRVADFCCICRTVQPFRVYETRETTYFLMIPLRFTRSSSFKAACGECGLMIPIQTDLYHSFSKNRHADLVELTQQTFPDIREIREPRLALEQQRQGDAATISPEDRSHLLEEPLRATAWMLHDLSSMTSETDHKAKDGCLLSALCFLALMFVMFLFEDNVFVQNTWWILILLMIYFGVRNIIYRFRRVVRKLRSDVYPMIGRALNDLSPTREELKTAASALQCEDVEEAERFDPEKIYAAIQVARSSR